MTQQQELNGNFSPESWDYSRAFARSIGDLPSSFTSVIRLLVSDFIREPTALSEYGNFFAGRLLKSRSIQVPYYFAIKLVKPGFLSDDERVITNQELLKAFDGLEHAVLLATIYLHRHCKKFCPEPRYTELTERLQHSLNHGWMVGRSISAVGGGAGLFLGAFRYLGLLPLLKHDPDGFAVYFDYLAANNLNLDHEYEFSRWQCNSLQIALMMAQQLGFGLKYIVPLMRAVTTKSPLLTNDELEKVFRVTDVWIESLKMNHSAPAIPLPPQYYPNKMELDALLGKIAILTSTEGSNWLSKTKADVSEATTPHLLFDENSADEALSAQPPFPEELSNEVGEEAIGAISEKLLTEFLEE